MKGNIICTTAGFLGLLITAALPKPPIEYMNPLLVGVEYTAAVHEQVITDAKVGSVETLQMFSFYYAPFSFVQVSLGLGGGKFKTEKYHDRIFEGGYGLSTAGGLYLSSPAFLQKRLRLTLDGEILYLNSRDGEGYRYCGPVSDPAVGLLFHVAPGANLEGGMRWHVINGTMSGGGDEKPFSNPDYRRYFLALTAVAPVGVYLQVDLTASGDAVSGFFEDGLKGSALSVKVGGLLGRDRKNRELDKRNSAFFPEYDKMKKKQEEMSGDINSK